MFVFDGLIMGVQKGEFVVVVGLFGCGKLMFMKLVIGLISLQEGMIEVVGYEVDGLVLIVGMVFQNLLMLFWCIIFVNVMLLLEIVQLYWFCFWVEKIVYIVKVEVFLDLVGFVGFGEKFFWQLFGGMQQRVNLCCVLIYDLVLLMLDELFGVLDVFMCEEFWQVMWDFYVDKGFIIIFVIYDL